MIITTLIKGKGIVIVRQSAQGKRVAKKPLHGIVATAAGMCPFVARRPANDGASIARGPFQAEETASAGRRPTALGSGPPPRAWLN